MSTMHFYSKKKPQCVCTNQSVFQVFPELLIFSYVKLQQLVDNRSRIDELFL